MTAAAIYARVSSDKQRGARDREPDGGADRVRQDAGLPRSPTPGCSRTKAIAARVSFRPGLERIRDLAAEGQIHAYGIGPDRLSRKYAYQVLLIEEFARHGVETVFLNAPQTATPEDQLLVQFQGMIAEYERAQILERSRRGKRHRAQQGQVSVLSGAPYGYHYVRKSEDRPAFYEILDTEADIVRRVYERYTIGGLSIGAIIRELNDDGVPTRSAGWERSTVWAILRNPAYIGTACFGKTRTAPRQRITRPIRQRGRVGSARQCASRTTASGLDRDPSSGPDQRRDFRARPGTARAEQDPRASPHHRAQHRAGPRIVQQVRLRVVAMLNPLERSQHPLLSVHRFG